MKTVKVVLLADHGAEVCSPITLTIDPHHYKTDHSFLAVLKEKKKEALAYMDGWKMSDDDTDVFVEVLCEEDQKFQDQVNTYVCEVVY